MMDFNSLWSLTLSVVVGGFGFFIREKLEAVKLASDDVRRLERLLNITREELAKEYATNAEVQRITDYIDQRFNRLEAKIDQLIQAGK
jgi:hypothetical protein